MSGILIVGAGGHAKVVLSTLLASNYHVEGCLDEQPSRWGTSVLGYPVLGGLELLERPDRRAVLAIGNNQARRTLSERYPAVEWVSAVHPQAVVDASVVIGVGSVVFAGAVVQADTTIGNHVIVNTAATVDHDCVLEDYVHVAPGTHLAGQVRLEQGAFLGIGSVATPGITVGEWTTVGAGGVVIRDLLPHSVAVGVPARQRQVKNNDDNHNKA
ncbi:transferase [Deinococcus irradiatisoli]|uniref:Transferase n=1 Tax=Deinococcus irradiatisoli TaxID=2202254 RepID=A0A2Z3JJI1_9DEIO|nr:acetyltransferase [Deinococcus irradiatisoli]AWN23741.1 transferase [Deinococcus irradiatisoli]